MLDNLLNVPPAVMPTVVIPMAADPDIIGAIGEAVKRHLARFILIGNKNAICALADQYGEDISGSEFVEETDGGQACTLAAQLVHSGRAQVLMKGLVHTATFSKAFLNREFGLVEATSLVSHIAVFELPSYHKPLLITDAALNITPSVAAKKCILTNAVKYAVSLGIDQPKVACIAAVEKVNPRIISTTDAAALKTAGEAGEFAPAIVDGPYGLDVAISKDAAETKGVHNPVAGDADILLMPALDAANVLYKTLSNFTDCRIGCSIAGAKVPIVLTSRADTEETRLLSLALAVRLSQGSGSVLH
ncbi:hypothetical protein BVX99_00605 [bacterium F16]|nr:hypothetical protein BVX99_00605 [bacterium F16]